MITNDDIVENFNKLTQRVTSIDDDAVELARWAYEKGKADSEAVTFGSTWIKPKFKVGDKVTVFKGKEPRTIVEVSPSYRLEGDTMNSCIWGACDLTEYKEEPLKVGDKVRCDITGTVGTILCIHGKSAWVSYNISNNSTGIYPLNNLERV